MNTWGDKLKVSIFGESHGKGIGIVIDGIPSGTELDTDEIRREMQRRAPGRDAMSTARNEADEVEILSGFSDGKTTGTPLAGVIYNNDMRSRDYTPELMRPGHADYTGFLKYGEAHDFRGGGHFSGRITAPLVFAGAIAKQVLRENGIAIGAHILRIGKIDDAKFDSVNVDRALLDKLAYKDFPTINDEFGIKMKEYIKDKRSESDSVGGIAECAVLGMPGGVGSPFFGSIESRISSMMFSIPAVKGIEFGAGFGFADMTGFEANDEFYYENDIVKTRTNNNAGINGGISNGMPIVFRTVIKPTPSIARVQKTVNIKTKENTEIQIRGRHDPCIVHRAISVVEAGTALAILDMMLSQ